MRSKIESGEFVILAEMEPPKGVDVKAMTSNASRVKGLIDAFVVPEMNSAVMRMSSLGGSILLQNRGLPAVMQVNCRDRNRLALQADLLAASACGIRTVMAVTGDDTTYGDHHQAKAVHDIELLELLEAIGKMGQGRDMAGIELQGSPDFLVGSTINPMLEAPEADVLHRKMEAGAVFFTTPPVFDTISWDQFIRKADEHKAKIIPTVLLLKSVGMARYIDRNLNHIYVPSSLIQRLQKSPERERESVKIAAETINALRQEGFGGVLISTMGWEQKLPEIIHEIRG
jgi:5,10-methylenetetrahydrofolate reductase